MKKNNKLPQAEKFVSLRQLADRNKGFSSIKLIFIILLLLIFANLIYLDIASFQNTQNFKQNMASPTPSTPADVEKVTSSNDQSCSINCLSKIYEATSSLKLNQQPVQQITAPATPQPKEFFIPFGSGSSSAADWQDVLALQATIDSTNYPKIKNVVFEVSFHIPTGNETAYVRLYNVTDKHPVWYSDVSGSGGNAQFLVSKPITLDQGSKVYQVQMKTSLQFPTILDQARIHITTY